MIGTIALTTFTGAVGVYVGSVAHERIPDPIQTARRTLSRLYEEGQTVYYRLMTRLGRNDRADEFLEAVAEASSDEELSEEEELEELQKTLSECKSKLRRSSTSFDDGFLR